MGSEDKVKTPTDVAANVNTGLSIGIQGGFSIKVGGSNFSFFINFGSIPIASSNGIKISGSGSGVTVNQGVEVGAGPVGVSSNTETNMNSTKSGFTTTVSTQTSANVLNVETSTTSTTTTTSKNETQKSNTTTEKSSSIGVTQSVKGGLFIVGEASAKVSMTNNGTSTSKKPIDPIVRTDATQVKQPVPPLLSNK